MVDSISYQPQLALMLKWKTLALALCNSEVDEVPWSLNMLPSAQTSSSDLSSPLACCQFPTLGSVYLPCFSQNGFFHSSFSVHSYTPSHLSLSITSSEKPFTSWISLLLLLDGTQYFSVLSFTHFAVRHLCYWLYFSGLQNHCRWWLQPWN